MFGCGFRDWSGVEWTQRWENQVLEDEDDEYEYVLAKKLVFDTIWSNISPLKSYDEI